MKILRTVLDLTQEEAAEKCSTSHRIYCNWENGVNTPRKDSQKKIAKAFGVSVEDLFSSIYKQAIFILILGLSLM